jgi:hypothetical protein
MSQKEDDMSQEHIDAVNAAGVVLVNNVRELKLPLIETSNTEQLLKQLNAIIASVSSIVAAIKDLENSKPSIYEKKGLSDV